MRDIFVEAPISTVKRSCPLCLQVAKLQESHIIPRFVGKWIKETSATGFLRGAEKPVKRLQDLPTLPLLCEKCEERFSAFETYFANEIFYPFLEKKVRSFEYDGRLLSFLVSLGWRVLKANQETVALEAPYHSPSLDKAEVDWRNFLGGKTTNIQPGESHLFFLEGNVEGTIPEKFDWYVERTTDTTIGGDKNRIFAYTKFPMMVFVTSVYPTQLEGWHGTLVGEKGRISSPQNVEDEGFASFLVSRANIVAQAISSKSPTA